MPRTKKFEILRQQVLARPGAAERIEALRQQTLAEIGLYHLRVASELIESELAERLTLPGSTVASLDHVDDVLLSTLRGYVEALGGRLELRAVFPDRTVTLLLGDDEREPDIS